MPSSKPSVCLLVFRILRCSTKALVIHLHPVDVCKCLAIHFVNEQAALQVVHLVLDDACCPPTGLPYHLISSGVQPCKGSYSLGEDMLNCIILNLLTNFPCPWMFLFTCGNIRKELNTSSPSWKRCTLPIIK